MMSTFIPREKLSKKKQREIDRQARKGWNGLNPVTRKPQNPKAYNRKKIRQDDTGHALPDFLYVQKAIRQGGPQRPALLM